MPFSVRFNRSVVVSQKIPNATTTIRSSYEDFERLRRLHSIIYQSMEKANTCGICGGLWSRCDCKSSNIIELRASDTVTASSSCTVVVVAALRFPRNALSPQRWPKLPRRADLNLVQLVIAHRHKAILAYYPTTECNHY